MTQFEQKSQVETLEIKNLTIRIKNPMAMFDNRRISELQDKRRGKTL